VWGTRRAILQLAAIAGVFGAFALSPAGALAAADDPLGFQFTSDTQTVHEDAGQATILVQRSLAEAALPAQVRYITSGDGYDPSTGGPFACGSAPCTAVAGIDFTSVKGELDFGPGQTTAQFQVPITDHGVTTVQKTLQIALFGPSPIGLGPTSHSVLVILEDDPVIARDPSNPLALPTAPSGPNPLAGARFFVDPQSEAANAAAQYPALSVIANQPGTLRFGKFSYGSPYVPDIATAVSRYLSRAAIEQPGAVPMLATYTLVHGVRGNGDPASFQAWYHTFIEGLAEGIGSYRAVLFLEEDSIITTPGLNAHGLATRMAELNDAISVLSANCPHLVIYLDAGAADALPAARAAAALRRAGVAKIQGFFLNSTHYDWTLKEIRYGEQISRLTGGKHFVVNTGGSGQGPLNIPVKLRPKLGNEELCNPVGRGLGPKPTTNTGYPKVDAFAWTTNPGESGGQCHDHPQWELQGAPSTGSYWPQYALMLVKNANFSVR
jgi:endoglucanase